MADISGAGCIDANGKPLQPPYNSPCGEYLNVGDAEIKGAELEMEARPIPGMLIDGSISYLDFAFVKSTSPAVKVGATAPAGIGKWKWSVGIQYEIPFLYESSLIPRIDVNHTPGSCGDLACTPILKNYPYTIVNGRLTLVPGGDSGWSLAMEARNLTNEIYYRQKFNAGSGFIGGQIAPPREWTITLRKDF